MAKTKTEMFTLIGANLPDNTTGLITPEKLREVMTQMADSPIYATPGVKEVEVLRAASSYRRGALERAGRPSCYRAFFLTAHSTARQQLLNW